MLGNGITASHVGIFHEVMKNGSPSVLSLAGRAFGLGEAEQTALINGKVPFWIWVTLGITGGVVIGIQIHKRWPSKIPEALR